MTTAFAWTIRGEVARAWRANPAGSLIALGLLVSIPWFLIASARGRPGPFRSLEQPLVAFAVASVALALASWAVRMTIFGGR